MQRIQPKKIQLLGDSNCDLNISNSAAAPPVAAAPPAPTNPTVPAAPTDADAPMTAESTPPASPSHS